MPLKFFNLFFFNSRRINFSNLISYDHIKFKNSIFKIFQDLGVRESGKLLLEFKKPGNAKITDSCHQFSDVHSTEVGSY